MPTLSDAYTNCLGVLKPQRQGTCALYSFWFATLLLNDLNTLKKPIVYPRKSEQRDADASVTRGNEDVSLRQFATQMLHSGQGELLTVSEVISMIVMFSWGWVAHVSGGDDRKQFITDQLSRNRPIMFAHLAGGHPSKPITAIPIDRQCGPHWSLIIGEVLDQYEYIDPNHPLKTELLPKEHILRSNEIVDDFAMDKAWVKPKHRPDGKPMVLSSASLAAVKSANPTLDLTPVKSYVIDRRQQLNNMLVAVY
jgi:hypothetical protein